MQNHLKNQTSPYLLQHVNNPVDWYPWCEEAFERAKREDKPIFLSIGYSTCHWCHVMAHESFEDEGIAELLNRHFISIKVDKEERPDIDSIYMSVCQALTGNGGWPTTIFLTPEQKPFYAGTYFPKRARYGQMGLEQLLMAIHEKWIKDRERLLESAEEIVTFLKKENEPQEGITGDDLEELIDVAVILYKRNYDSQYGGFGEAPKFPAPHNLLFLMKYYEKSRDKDVLEMVEKTLLQMYRGGMFDHIGGGFSRYSTDRFFLAPHFEKMLYDNALLIMAYCKMYQLTQNPIYRSVAEKTAIYIMREMTDAEGGFYSAQDADSEGVEGKYYLFEPKEITDILGSEEGENFNQHYDITEMGNFEGKNIPNLLKHSILNEAAEVHLQTVYEYRKKRYSLHLDDKILTLWNGLMIGAMCYLYRVTGEKGYVKTAEEALNFLEQKLCDGENLYVSYREGKRTQKGFLDDYASVIFALFALYEATLSSKYLESARRFCKKAISDFYDEKQGGFYLYGKENEQLVLCPKETYDGALPSGNSLMAYNLVRLWLLTGEKEYEEVAKQQIHFMGAEAANYPSAHAMFLWALSDYIEMPAKVTIVVKEEQDLVNLSCRIPLDTLIGLKEEPTTEYPLHNDRTTFYVCKGHSCFPPVNELGSMTGLI